MQKFKDLKTLNKYTEKHGRFEEGEIVQTSDDEKLYIYHEKQWTPIDGKVKATGLEMNLYDLNKQIMAQLEPYTTEQWEEKEKEINEWGNENQADYYMMLCKEKSYYTIFVNNPYVYEYQGLGTAVIDCLKYINGDIVSIDIDPEKVEIWVKTTDNDAYCMYLFDYDEGVVSFKR